MHHHQTVMLRRRRLSFDTITRCVWHLATCVLLAATASVQAESLVSVATSPLATLAGNDPISRVWVADERPVALGANFTWILDDSEEQWVSVDWRPRGEVLGVASDQLRTFLLLGSEPGGPVTRIERFSLLSAESGSAPLPRLQVQLVSAGGALLQDRLFVVGTSPDGMPAMVSIDPFAADPQWRAHEAWSGYAGSVSSVVAQNSMLLVTVAGSQGAGERMLQWNQADGWKERNPLSGTVVEGTGRAIGPAHVLYLVAGDAGRGSKLELMSFHTITGSWATYGELDATGARSGAGWKDGIFWLLPAEHDAGATFAIAEIESGKQLLDPVDWGVIIVYLFGMLGMGLYFYRQDAQGSATNFFVGGRSIPFWAAGISLYASNASSISYIAVPAKAFATNWQYLMSNLIVVLGLIFVAIWIVPLLRRLELMSVFQYLETRFHPVIRVLSSALFIVFQLAGRMTVILFLPSLAISTVTGTDVVWSILIMGGVTICYTVLGGMKAVIWTDVLQLFVMFGGTLFAIGFVVFMLDGGVAEFLATASADGKMKLVDWSFDLTEATVWGFVFLVVFDTVLTFPKDQVLMQRVLSTSSAKQAGRSVWTFAAIVIPGSVMFYLIGTALYVFYQSRPERLDPLLSIDATFPLFIAAELPIGVTGLIIAGIFAASMSTLSSILNSVATLVTVDFYEKLVTNPNPKTSVRFAQLMTIVAGLIGIGLALLLSRFEIDSLLDVALELWGLLGGGFAGAYTLGMFSRRANWQGVVIGVATSILVTVLAWSVDLVHPYFYLPLSVCVCIVVGYTASWFFPPPSVLEGLTIFEKEAVAAPPAR